MMKRMPPRHLDDRASPRYDDRYPSRDPRDNRDNRDKLKEVAKQKGDVVEVLE